LLIVFLFIAGWRSTFMTWALFGAAGGIVYVCWEVLQRFRAPIGEEKPRVNLSWLLYGFLAWPIMVPEAIEYTLAELGVLSSSMSSSPDAEAE
jgi:hypothetical protein